MQLAREQGYDECNPGMNNNSGGMNNNSGGMNKNSGGMNSDQNNSGQKLNFNPPHLPHFIKCSRWSGSEM